MGPKRVLADPVAMRDALTSRIQMNLSRSSFTLPPVPRPDNLPSIITAFKNQEIATVSSQVAVLKRATEIMRAIPNVQKIEVPLTGTLTIVGDVHGQFYDVLDMFRKNGTPSAVHKYLFNGDLVDRGSWGMEIVLLLACWIIAIPGSVFINRGNHESSFCTQSYGFQSELRAKDSAEAWSAYLNFFQSLPLCSVVNAPGAKPGVMGSKPVKIFVVHGGLPSNPKVQTLREVDRISRFKEPDDTLLGQLLWSDPHPGLGLRDSPRPFCKAYGSDITERFLEVNKMDFVIRSHEVVDGHTIAHGGRLITLFSAPNTGGMSNKAEYLRIDGSKSLPIRMEEWDYQPMPGVEGHPAPLFQFDKVGCCVM